MKRQSANFQPLTHNDLIHSWGEYDFGKRRVTTFDTTLRDGLQSPYSQQHIPLREKILFLEAAAKVGIEAMEIGFPIASTAHHKEVSALARYIKTNKLRIVPSCLARTTPADVESVARIAEESGCPMTINLLIGSSKLRQLVEEWNPDTMVKWISDSIKLAHKYGLTAEFVTEDTTRTDPQTLKKLYSAAIAAGATGLWIADTVGAATPNSTRKLTQFFRKQIIGKQKITLDWHGHDDKNLGTANSLAAAEAGANRIQATALGIGERAGNTPMEPVIINLNLAKANNYHLEALTEYSSCAARMFHVSIPKGHAGVGEYVFSTAAGMHASAIVKARKIGRPELTGLVYCPFPPELFARQLEIFIGPMSGRANVQWHIQKLKTTTNSQKIETILSLAKNEYRFLTHEEIHKLLQDS